MSTPNQHILDALHRRLTDPSTPAADLAAIAQAHNAISGATVNLALVSAGIEALQELKAFSAELRQHNAEEKADRAEWRRIRQDRDEKNTKLAAENKKLKKKIKELQSGA